MQRDDLQPARARLLLPGWFVVAALGVALTLLAYQLPARHTINIGGYDAAYVQGFADAEPAYRGTPPPADAVTPPPPPAYLAGSDGTARWTGERAYLLLPQAGLPAEVRLRVRGWRPAGDPPPTLAIWQNGRELLATVPLNGDWQEIGVALSDSVAAGLLKPADVVLELRSDTATLPDGREVGVLVDAVEYRTTGLPLLPYPAQLAVAVLLAGLLWLLLRPTPAPPQWAWLARLQRVPVAGWLGLYAVLFLLLYRWQPPLYPYPLRGLPLAAVGLVGTLVLVRDAPPLLHRLPWLVRLALLLVLLGGMLLIGQAARQHVTLAEPGVEADFRVFATRTSDLAELFRADGFYNLGYPLVLSLVQPLTSNNPFLAAQVVAVASALLLLLATFVLARQVLPDIAPVQRDLYGVLAVLLLLGSPLVVQYALYVGSDMPFAALFVSSIVLLYRATTTPAHRRGGLVLAGAVAGAAFLMRHPGLILLVWGAGYIGWWYAQQAPAARADWRSGLRLVGWFGLGWLLAAAPQLVVNVLQTGQPLYSQQAKNIWLAVYGNTDWQRWGEVPNSIGLQEIVLRDPARFLANWFANLRAYLGTGAEDTREFGRAVQIRLLAFPANWLGVLGLAGGLIGWRRASLPVRGLLVLTVLYVAGIATAFVLPRFVLPLAAVYAVAAVGLVQMLLRPVAGLRGVLLVLLAALLLVPGGIRTGTQAVLANQPAAQVEIVRLLLATLPPDERVLTYLPAANPLGKYSAVAHRTVPLPATVDASDTAAVLAAAEAAEVRVLLWDLALGIAPPPEASEIGQAGTLRLYRLP